LTISSLYSLKTCLEGKNMDIQRIFMFSKNLLPFDDNNLTSFVVLRCRLRLRQKQLYMDTSRNSIFENKLKLLNIWITRLVLCHTLDTAHKWNVLLHQLDHHPFFTPRKIITSFASKQNSLLMMSILFNPLYSTKF
jgi:ribosomal protein L10